MGIWYRRVLTLETFRNVSMGSKLLARTPVSLSPIPGKVPHFSNEWNLGFCGSSSISSRLFHLGSSGGGRRSYKFPTFKPKLGSKKRYEKPRNIWLALCLGSGITVYTCNLETIPYTNRTHLVLFSIETEKRLGKTLFKDLIKQKRLEGKILAADHPESVRANSIAKNMIEALENGLLILQSDQDLGSHDQFTMETGLMLMASAGYDPRTAISTYEKLTDLSHNREERLCLCNMRAKLDPQGHAIKKAMNLYRP